MGPYKEYVEQRHARFANARLAVLVASLQPSTYPGQRTASPVGPGEAMDSLGSACRKIKPIPVIVRSIRAEGTLPRDGRFLLG